MTDRVAEEALNLTGVVVADLSQARRSGQFDSIVDATVDVFQGVVRHLSAPRNVRSEGDGESTQKKLTDEEKLMTTLKARADGLCDVATRNSAPDANAVSSVSDDFLFNCQKIEQSGPSTAQTDGSHEAT